MKLYLTTTLLLFSICALAQTNTFPSSGNTGIGTTSPSSALQLVGEFRLGGNTAYTDLLIKPATPLTGYNQTTNIMSATAPGSGIARTALHLKSQTSGGSNIIDLLVDGQVGIGINYPTDKFDVAGKFLINNDGIVRWGGQGEYGRLTWDTGIAIMGGQENIALSLRANDQEKMRIATNGNVGIGTISPTEKLEVNGKIRTKEIKVETSNWPDYVFKPQYNLLPIRDLEKFIQKNGHLPEMPTANEAETKGIELGEMNKLLLKKIEELTLHIINQNKRIEALEENK